MPLSGAVEVWVADLSAPRERSLEALSEQELERAARLLHDEARMRWCASRALLRELLAQATGADPAGLRFELGEHGKPRLRCSSGSAPHFNMSHSGSLALYAISRDREVGVDVEALDRGRAAARDEVAIARRMLGAEVAERLSGLEGPRRTREFLAAWVAFEARVKCLGHGVGAAERPQDPVAEPVWVGEVPVGVQAVAAVAVRGGEAAVRVRQLSAGCPGAPAQRASPLS